MPTIAKPHRNFDQIFGYWIDEPAILDHSHVVRAMADLGRSGYGIVRLFVRETNFMHRSPEVVATIRVAVEEVHRHGMRAVLDCEPHHWVARDMGMAYPAAIGQRLHRVSGPLRDGAFRVDLQLADMGTIIFDHVASVVVQDAKGLRTVPVPACEQVWETTVSNDGIADSLQEFKHGRTWNFRRHVGLKGRIDGGGNGTAILYVAFRERHLIDFAAPETRRWYRDLVEAYRDIPLDGIGWDEPAVAGNWSSYRYGQAFARVFAERNGYALADRLHLLDAPGLSPESVRVRLDYYRTLNETLAEAQADMIAAAQERFGKDLLLGTHHTWQGEGGINDYRAGAVDYFRLNDSMDAGYTDTCWWDPRSVCYSYILGSSLGRLTPSGEIECNTWHWKPTIRTTRFNARFMSLMHVTWFNIWYGEDADTARYPSHYAWPATVACMRRHQRYQRFIGKAKPVVEVAVLHDWQGVCGTNTTFYASLHKAFCLNLSKWAVDANLPFDFIDARLLGSATIEGDVLATALGRYRVLVLPSASVIDRAAWERILAFVRAGGRVVFAGAPPSILSEGGDISAAFAELMGMPALHADDYDSWFRSACPGAVPTNRPERYDLAYPLPISGPRAIVSIEGDVHGIRAPKGQVVWFSGYEASTSVLSQCQEWVKPAVQCHSSTVLWRCYRQGDRTLVMLVAREDGELSGIIEAFGHTVRLQGGESACLVIDGQGSMTVHGEDDAAKVTVNR